MKTENDPRFLEPRLKVDRANSHILDLNKIIETFIRNRGYRVFIDNQSEPEFCLLVMERAKPLPSIIPLIVGDIVHNLRSALDILLYRVAALPADFKLPAFPTTAKISEFDNALKQRKIAWLGPWVEDYLRSLQPYPGGCFGIWELHQMDITDKHKLILPANHAAHIERLKIEVGNSSLNFRNCRFIFEERLILARAPPGTQIKLDKHVKPGVEITFAEGFPFAGKPIVPTLRQASKFISEIINVFARHCSFPL